MVMKRRDFVRGGLSGLGLAALSSSVLRAAPPGVLTATPAPLPVSPPVSPISPALAALSPYGPLLDRARAALAVHKDRIPLRDRVALVDFSAASHVMRFHIVDLIGGQTSSYLCAHGRGSDPAHTGYLQSFSNEPNSLATSDGAYVTGPIYDGVHGAAMRLVGLDPTNNNADVRAIVIHSAPYVSEDHIVAFGKLGRSEGCFVVAPHLISQVLGLLGPDRMVYAAKV
ncbi:hypothetical protein BH10PSE13_BH10PSE13_18370 [soil metagenome]